MMKKLLLPIAALIVLSIATPSFATFWNNNKRDRNFDWSGQQDKQWDHDWDCDTDHEWPNLSQIKDWLENKDWSRGSHDWDGWCNKSDNPVPEPATAGLSLMGLAALGVATRRRRK